MCAPAVVAGLAISAVGSGVSMYAQKKQGDFEAQVGQNNAELARQQAVATRQVGAMQAARIEDEGRQVAGAATAALAANSIETTTGSAAAMIATSQATAAADAATVRANAARSAWGYSNEAQDLLATAKQRKRAGILGGVSTGLSAVGGLLSAYGRS